MVGGMIGIDEKRTDTCRSPFSIRYIMSCSDTPTPNPFPILQRAVRQSSSKYTMSLGSLMVYSEPTPQGVGEKHGSYVRYLAKKKAEGLLGRAGEGKARHYPAVAGCECE